MVCCGETTGPAGHNIIDDVNWKPADWRELFGLGQESVKREVKGGPRIPELEEPNVNPMNEDGDQNADDQNEVVPCEKGHICDVTVEGRKRSSSGLQPVERTGPASYTYSVSVAGF